MGFLRFGPKRLKHCLKETRKKRRRTKSSISQLLVGMRRSAHRASGVLLSHKVTDLDRRDREFLKENLPVKIICETAETGFHGIVYNKQDVTVRAYKALKQMWRDVKYGISLTVGNIKYRSLLLKILRENTSLLYSLGEQQWLHHKMGSYFRPAFSKSKGIT